MSEVEELEALVFIHPQGAPELQKRLQGNGMRRDVSWTGPAKQYASLYSELLAPKD